MKSEIGRRRWVAGALRAGRAAAFLTLATGINGTVAALEPRYEPLYVYLAAVVIVAWLGSLLLGVTTAVAAVILYDAMFSPLERNLSWAGALPFVVAIGAAVVTRMARVPVERSRAAFAPSTAPPLLETSPPKIVDVRPAVDVDEVEDLREQLASAARDLDRARTQTETMRNQLDGMRDQAAAAQKHLDETRAQAERDARVHIEQAATAKARLSGLQHELDTARTEAIEQAKRAAALQGEVDAARVRLREAEARLAETTQELEVAWRRVDEEKARADEAASRANEAASSANEAAARADHEKKRLHDLERRANEALQQATTEIAARYQEPLAEAKKRLEDAFTRIPLLENQRDAAVLAAGEASARANALGEETARLRADLDEARGTLEAERLQRRQLEAEAKELAARVQTAAKKIAETRSELDQARSRIELERSERERLEAAYDQKIAGIAERLTHDYEESMGEAMVEKETARAEARALRLELDRMRNKLELERAQRESIEADLMPAARAEIASLTSTIETLQREASQAREQAAKVRWDTVAEYSAKLTQSEARAAAASQQVERLSAELEDIGSTLELERAAHERALADFDRKIASIVANITSDHEHAIGEAMIEKEAARAEVRALNKKVETLQQKLEEEKAARAKADGEWSEKLQTIVTHLASDHEADLGEAMLEKEAAKAEVRVLTTRLKTMEQKLDLMRRQSMETLRPGRAIVLVVHTDAATRAMAKHALEEAGYSVITAADGLEALRMASSEHPDVVVAETTMPKLAGREFEQLLKARNDTAGIKVALMSGSEFTGVAATVESLLAG